MSKKDRAILKKANTLENKLQGYERLTYEELTNEKIPICGYLRLPHTNHKGVVQGYCSLKENNCLKFKDYMTKENCHIYQNYFKKK